MVCQLLMLALSYQSKQSVSISDLNSHNLDIVQVQLVFHSYSLTEGERGKGNTLLFSFSPTPPLWTTEQFKLLKSFVPCYSLTEGGRGKGNTLLFFYSPTSPLQTTEQFNRHTILTMSRLRILKTTPLSCHSLIFLCSKLPT